MEPTIHALATFLHLARLSGQRHRPHVRDRFLVRAAILASRLRLPRIAAACRELVLEHNRHHLIGNWPTLEQALGSPEFLQYARQLERRCGLERAEHLLAAAGIDLAREREAYFSDEEYAAACLGWDLDQLADRFDTPD